MERRFQVRLRELVEDAVVAPEVFAGMMPRIERFVEPFAAAYRKVAERAAELREADRRA